MSYLPNGALAGATQVPLFNFSSQYYGAGDLKDERAHFESFSWKLQARTSKNNILLTETKLNKLVNTLLTATTFTIHRRETETKGRLISSNVNII